MDEFIKGSKIGLPIALGYFPVAFSFGIMVSSSHLPLGLATLISLTNLTSSGQFAGVSLMIAQANYIEIALTLLLINARYILMSLSLSQKIDQKMSTVQRMIVSFGITDEIFSLAAIQDRKLTYRFMLGMIVVPIIGWVLGTLVGETLMNYLPANLQSALQIALYGMFLAIIVPASKESRAILKVVLIAGLLMAIFYYLPLFDFLSSGFKLIMATIIAAIYGALKYPVNEVKE